MKCKICDGPNKKQIERSILLGATYTQLSKDYKISYPTLRTHKELHMPLEVAEDMKSRMVEFQPPAFEADRDIPSIDNILNCLSYLHTESLFIYGRAKEEEDFNLALKAIKQDLECVGMAIRGHELLLSYQSQGDWEKILPKILKAVEPFKHAKQAIADALYSEAEEHERFKNKEMCMP